MTIYCTLSHSFLPLCFSAQFCVRRTIDASKELRNKHKISIDSKSNDVYPGFLEAVGNLGEVLKNDTFL